MHLDLRRVLLLSALAVSGLLGLGLLGGACSRQEESPPHQSTAAPERPSTPASPTSPTRPILFQPWWFYKGTRPRAQGTGFLTTGPHGRLLAVTSAHFIDFDGPPLREAHWADMTTDDSILVFTECWGKPGRKGTVGPLDLRPDYLLLPAPKYLHADVALEMDRRDKPTIGERVWFPDKDPDVKPGYRVVAGTVTEAPGRYVEVRLDEKIELYSQSGSPIISQKTGGVIGMFSRASTQGDEQFIWLTPAKPIREAIEKAEGELRLTEAIGKKQPATAPAAR